MRLSGNADGKLLRLSSLTGIRRRDSLLELGRIADIVDVPPGSDALTDWTGADHAIAVVAGGCRHNGVQQVVGDVFVTRAYERVASLGAVVLVAPPAQAETLRRLCARRAATRIAPQVTRSAPTTPSTASLISR